MKQTFFYFLLISSISFSQNLNNLDLKNGFKQFKLGSSPGLIKDIVRNEGKENRLYNNNPNIKCYDYLGNGNEYIFNVEIESISLKFFKDKLVSILVSFGRIGNDFDKEKYDFVLYSLELAYGKKWQLGKSNDEDFIEGASWTGKNVTLELSRNDFSNKYDFVGGYIYVFDEKLNQEIAKSQL
jgi:hypothetical protein